MIFPGKSSFCSKTAPSLLPEEIILCLVQISRDGVNFVFFHISLLQHSILTIALLSIGVGWCCLTEAIVFLCPEELEWEWQNVFD